MLLLADLENPAHVELAKPSLKDIVGAAGAKCWRGRCGVECLDHALCVPIADHSVSDLHELVGTEEA